MSEMYTLKEIESALSRLGGALTDTAKKAVAEMIIAELIKSKQTFREGEVMSWIDRDGHQCYRKSNKSENDYFNITAIDLQVRHLKPSELPQYVHDLRAVMASIAVNDNGMNPYSADEMVAQLELIASEAINAFDAGGE